MKNVKPHLKLKVLTAFAPSCQPNFTVRLCFATKPNASQVSSRLDGIDPPRLLKSCLIWWRVVSERISATNSRCLFLRSGAGDSRVFRGLNCMEKSVENRPLSIVLAPKLPRESTSLEGGYASSPIVLRAARTSIFHKSCPRGRHGRSGRKHGANVLMFPQPFGNRVHLPGHLGTTGSTLRAVAILGLPLGLNSLFVIFRSGYPD